MYEMEVWIMHNDVQKLIIDYVAKLIFYSSYAISRENVQWPKSKQSLKAVFNFDEDLS